IFLVSSPRSFFRSSLRLVWLAVAVTVIALAALLGSMRLLLPLADRYRDEVAQLVGRALDRPVAITGLGASWRGFGPGIELEGVTVLGGKGEPLVRCAGA